MSQINTTVNKFNYPKVNLTNVTTDGINIFNATTGNYTISETKSTQNGQLINFFMFILSQTINNKHVSIGYVHWSLKITKQLPSRISYYSFRIFDYVQDPIIDNVIIPANQTSSFDYFNFEAYTTGNMLAQCCYAYDSNNNIVNEPFTLTYTLTYTLTMFAM